ncbi:AraC family transcriptional regulator [Peptoniphilus catoniae]|uniref:AraC family transcriptional regulator n=1 Tax=Peptoniphilus catoniae TaxID=1660341 RepID=UPI0010FD0BE7|nr:AraC family transcriptional regulator [Peptoniphilus catoniae]
MDKTFELQTHYCSSFDKKKICSYDIEQIKKPTSSIMHKESRFLFFTKGEGIIRINGLDYEIVPNSCIGIIPWEVTNMIEVKSPMQFIKIVYDFNFINQNLKSIYRTSGESIDIFGEISNSPIVYFDKASAEKVMSITEEIRSEVGMESALEIKKEKALVNAFLINKITELLILYIRANKKTESNSENIKIDKKINIFRYLYSHLSEKHTLKSVASLFYMSESSLSKYCKKATGYSFHDLLDEMRLVKAMNLLTNSEFPLSLIAELTGFNDSSHLSKFFTKKLGTTPNQYRKSNKNVVNMFNFEEEEQAYNIVEYISDSFTEDINENLVAEKFSISVSELNRKLIYLVERNFDDFLNFLRINYACELLNTTDYLVIDVALASGYNNSKTFYNNFVKLKSMSPSKFRRSVEIQNE